MQFGGEAGEEGEGEGAGGGEGSRGGYGVRDQGAGGRVREDGADEDGDGEGDRDDADGDGDEEDGDDPGVAAADRRGVRKGGVGQEEEGQENALARGLRWLASLEFLLGLVIWLIPNWFLLRVSRI